MKSFFCNFLKFDLNILITIVLSEKEKLKETVQIIEDEVSKLEDDEKNISRKTSAIALLYKKKCLVDKSKSDAVKVYLTYHIELAKNESKNCQ